MTTALAMVTGFMLDLILGDPAWLPHPVVGLGKAISVLERKLRASFPQTPKGEKWAGRVLAAVLPLIAFCISWGILHLCKLVNPALYFAAESWMCYQILATRELWRQSGFVYTALCEQGLPQARTAVSRIVGRDTAVLDETGVIKATVETIAENASDGVVAPLVFIALGGAPLGMLYKAINTMDSMVGYKNEQYLHFGRAAAKLDDTVNFLASRFAAICMVVVAPLAGLSASEAWRVWRRDRQCHASPNSAQTEAATAGALGIQLAGDAVYFGKSVRKPTIGDAIKPVERADISRTNRLMVLASVLALLVCCLTRVAVLTLW